jgi:hypothetical protein
VVECHPSKVDVAGSNPVSRSIFRFLKHFFRERKMSTEALAKVGRLSFDSYRWQAN